MAISWLELTVRILPFTQMASHRIIYRRTLGVARIDHLIGGGRRHMDAGAEVGRQQEGGDLLGISFQRHHEARNAHILVVQLLVYPAHRLRHRHGIFVIDLGRWQQFLPFRDKHIPVDGLVIGGQGGQHQQAGEQRHNFPLHHLSFCFYFWASR